MLAVLYLVTLLLAAAVVVLAVRLRAALAVERRDERYDESANEMLPQVTEELRKTRAELSYWKGTAERLQRELDARDQP